MQNLAAPDRVSVTVAVTVTGVVTGTVTVTALGRARGLRPGFRVRVGLSTYRERLCRMQNYT